jgi:molybdenum cofactor cytidylyltransferase
MNEVITLILAAGSSSRMGFPKQLMPHKGKPLLSHVAGIAVLAELGPVCVVVGANAEVVRPVVQELAVQIVENPAWAEGMGTSIGSGMRFIEQKYPRAEAILLMLCDQPLVTPELLRKMVQRMHESGKLIVSCQYAGTFGPPALFARPVFAELATLSGPSGAKAIIQSHLRQTLFVPFPDGSVDLDTPEQLP